MSIISKVWRSRKLRRILGVRQINYVAIGVICITLLLTFFMLYRYSSSALHARTQTKTVEKRPRVSKYDYKSMKVTNIPMRHVPLNEIYEYSSEDERSLELNEGQQSFMVNTPGCQIPIALIPYDKHLPKNEITCGRKRAVFIKRHDDQHVRIRIKSRTMKLYLKKNQTFYCCHRFMKRSSAKGHEHTDIEYTNCNVIQDGEIFKLITDFINVKCFAFDKNNRTVVVYSDVYAFVKKMETKEVHYTRNHTKYNVLMIGMDSMSISRVSQTMPRTVGFFQDNFWLGFRGYHKVADNTFPNVMAAFTGKNYSAVTGMCAGKMDDCNQHMIWSRFKKSGYVTAHGEDCLPLETFKDNYVFRNPPTDHYLKPFYLHGEVRYFKRNVSIICNEHAPSGQHLLDYALDFAATYKKSSFFGVFWMNSYSHNENHHPQYGDRIFENFFNQLTYTGVLENTFIIFFSDHGIRFGRYRLLGESYYEERLPALFMWVPTRFKGWQSELYEKAAMNQFRLLTPYDLYNTLVEIHGISNSIQNYTKDYSKDCPNCHSIFKPISINRTCEDVGIHMKWCSCHRMYPLEVHDTEGIKSVLHAVSHAKSMVQNALTKPCWYCQPLSLKNIIRIHFYYIRLNLYYVVAFSMTPGNLKFEATVSRKGVTLELVGPLSIIEAYKGAGACVVNYYDKLFCICRKKPQC